MTDSTAVSNRSSRHFAPSRKQQVVAEPQSRESAIHSWVLGVHAEADSILASNGTKTGAAVASVGAAVAQSTKPNDEQQGITIVDSNNNSISITPDNSRKSWIYTPHNYSALARALRPHTSYEPRIVAATSTGIPIHFSGKKGRPESIASISSGESINLEDLIEHNTSINLDSDGEIPDMGGLELDDSRDDFWNVDEHLEKFFPKPLSLALSSSNTATTTLVPPETPLLIRPVATSSNPRAPDSIPKATSSRSNADKTRKHKYNKARVGGGGESDDSLEDFGDVDLDEIWKNSEMMEGEKDPEEDDFELGLGPTQGQTSPNLRALNHGGQRTSMYNRLPTSASHMRPRSGSMSSENSITSQSTVTGSHLPRAFSPTGHPDESTSTSSGGRSLSRLSDYSNGSQPSSTTGLARPRTVSTNNSTTSNNGPSLQAPTNSRLRSPATPTPTKLTRRSSHIPNTSMGARSPPEPSPTTSNASSTAEQYPTRSLSRISNFSNSSQGGTPSRRPMSTLPRPQTPTGPGTGRTTTMGLPASRMSMYGGTPPNRTRAGSNASSTGTPAYVSTLSRAPPTVTTTPPVRTSSVTVSSGTNRASRLPPPRAMSPSPGAQRTHASSANVSSPLGKRSETPTAGLRMSKIGIPALGRKTGT